MHESTDATYLAECFWPGVRAEEVEQTAERVRRAAAGSVSLTGTILVPEDEIVLFLFDSESAEAVRDVCESAGVPFERVVESVRTAENPPSQGQR